MNKNHVSNLELSKKMKKLGFEQNGSFIWDESYNPPWLRYFPNGKGYREEECVSAFTVAELGEMLPSNIKVRAIANGEHGGIYYLYTNKLTDYADNNFSCFYAMNNGQTKLLIENSNTEADARAKMLIYLMENELL